MIVINDFPISKFAQSNLEKWYGESNSTGEFFKNLALVEDTYKGDGYRGPYQGPVVNPRDLRSLVPGFDGGSDMKTLDSWTFDPTTNTTIIDYNRTTLYRNSTYYKHKNGSLIFVPGYYYQQGPGR